jgi:hypothetical protein
MADLQGLPVARGRVLPDEIAGDVGGLSSIQALLATECLKQVGESAVDAGLYRLDWQLPGGADAQAEQRTCAADAKVPDRGRGDPALPGGPHRVLPVRDSNLDFEYAYLRVDAGGGGQRRGPDRRGRARRRLTSANAYLPPAAPRNAPKSEAIGG